MLTHLFRFIKNNWFTATVVCLLVFVVARNNFALLHPNRAPKTPKKTEKYTDKSPEVAAQMGLLPGSSEDSPENAPDVAAQQFFQRFAHVAIAEQKKFKIPAAVILGCAGLRSDMGRAKTTQQANNFFALGCLDDWDGATASVGGKCYRSYDSAWASFRDFSIFMTTREWYGALRKTAGKDWKKWAKGLDGKAPFGKGFGAKLEEIIAQYDLSKFDK